MFRICVVGEPYEGSRCDWGRLLRRELHTYIQRLNIIRETMHVLDARKSAILENMHPLHAKIPVVLVVAEELVKVRFGLNFYTYTCNM